ncbi:MAG: carboxypeptidase regulatory-like domain-containing protein [Bryobacterales bacterium]|nr:carboxypeptidase regulatory-like domain-containing protein [Bryobacterales bacterium]
MSVLIIPIDAAQVAQRERGEQKLKVAVQDRAGKVRSEIVSIEQGKAEIRFEVDPKQALSVAVGPATASDEDIFRLQTLTARVSPAQWRDQRSLTIATVIVTPVWWRQWLRWCRDFVIEGRVICADGSPVPGAEVRAFDVDYFWWWSSISQTGPAAITDSTGNFTIKFRWCCGWLPIWWWRLRAWRLEPDLVDRIQPVLKLNPNLKFREPHPVPSFDMVALNPQPLPPRPDPISPVLALNRQLDPSVIPALRDRLVRVLPQVPELERLRIWPWFPWTPWLDCTPDLIFRVTQNCGGTAPKVIVNESVFQTRWDVPTNLNVTLIANQEACCLPDPGDEPEGDCALFTKVCLIPVNQIGGNSGADPAPVGYADPGGRDRPFSGVVSLYGQFGSAAQADFYELEYTPHGAGAWAPVPASALLAITRGYFDSTLAFPNQWQSAAFPVISAGGHQLYESRQHYEDTHPPANWGTPFGRSWYTDPDHIASIQTVGVFPDGAFDFRLMGYKAASDGTPDLTTGRLLDGCGNNQANNQLAVRFDNRVVGPAIPGTVHVNTTEPDCGITAVRIGGVPVAPCGAQQLQPGTPLEIDFFATDPDGHLDHYDLEVKYDLGSVKNLLNPAQVGTLSLTPLAGGPAGPDYSQAVTLPQTAVRPTWNGGSLRLRIDDASKVFPKTCCYLIELTVWKRNIVNCNGNLSYYNQMHYSFTVLV